MALREGHFCAMQKVFGYLCMFPQGHILINVNDPPIRQHATSSIGHSWIEFYPDADEDIPANMPKPHGPVSSLTAYVDADHARDKVTCRSVTGIVVLLDNTPITWICKRQKTVEMSTYGSEMVAARIAIDTLVEFHYKLRMLGIPVENTSFLVGDNMSVVINTTLPSSSLKKKHQACNYHCIREVIATSYLLFGHIDTKLNLANICTKPLPAPTFHALAAPYLFRAPRPLEKA